jgi:hypothetical protein
MRTNAYVVRMGLITVLSMILALGVAGAPRKDRRDRDTVNPIVRLVKKIIRSLGDGLVTPTP